MPALRAVALRRSMPGGALLALSLGLGLYQMTSLVLGTSSERVVQLSMKMPTIDVDQISGPIESDVTLVLGSRFVTSLPSIKWPAGTAARRSPSGSPPRASAAAPAASTAPKPSVTPLPTPVVVAPVTLYHDADERSPRLARRR